MHRDIKPQNILLCQGMVKLSDFGCSTYFDASSGRLNNTFCGTLDYLAPEMVMDDQNGYYTYKIDNWSIGILGYELMYGQTPFGHIES